MKTLAPVWTVVLHLMMMAQLLYFLLLTSTLPPCYRHHTSLSNQYGLPPIYMEPYLDEAMVAQRLRNNTLQPLHPSSSSVTSPPALSLPSAPQPSSLPVLESAMMNSNFQPVLSLPPLSIPPYMPIKSGGV